MERKNVINIENYSCREFSSNQANLKKNNVSSAGTMKKLTRTQATQELYSDWYLILKEWTNYGC